MSGPTGPRKGRFVPNGRSVTTRTLLTALTVALVALVVACSDGTSQQAQPKEIRIVTYDSYVLPEEAAAEFERRTGVRIGVTESGDSAEMLTKALLSAGAPEGDVIFGIDNTLVSRVLDSRGRGVGLLDKVDPSIAERVPTRYRLGGGADDMLVAIDHGDVCLNVDASWFDSHGITAPETLENLTDPTYAGLTVLPSPVTSGPGLAFLAGTVEHFGDGGWRAYWKGLARNGVRVRPSWSDAYYTDYTASGGDRPVVLSYASSPPAEVIFSEGKRKEPVSRVMDSSCVQQVEYAGVLAGTHNRRVAEQLVRFMLDDQWQKGLPLANFVYPVADVELPEEFERWAPPIADPIVIPPDRMAAGRERWIDEWRSIME